MNKLKIQKRIRKKVYNPKKFLRLHRGEYGHYIKNNNFDKNNYYPDIYPLINSLSKKEKIKIDNLTIGLGAESIIKDILLACKFLNKKSILISDPIFYMYNLYSKMLKLKINKFSIDPLNLKNFNYTSLIKKINKYSPDILVICNPFSPVEFFFNKKDSLKLINFCKKKKIIVIVDEVYLNENTKSFKYYLKKYDNLIVIKSLSKTMGKCGLRLGYSFSNKKIWKVLDSLRLSTEVPANTINDSMKLIKNFNSNTKKVRKNIILSKKILNNGLKKYGMFSINNSINSSLIYFKSLSEKELLGRYLLKKKIITNFNFNNFYLKNFMQIVTTNKNNIKLFLKYFDSFKKAYL